MNTKEEKYNTYTLCFLSLHSFSKVVVVHFICRKGIKPSFYSCSVPSIATATISYQMSVEQLLS